MRKLTRYLGDTRGAAGVELALWVSVLTLPILNVVDTGFYIYQRMQLENAAQAAAQAAWLLCDSSSKLPAATKCSGLQTALATAAQSTSLGTNAALQTSAEGDYCVNTSGVLTSVDTTAGVINTSGANTAPVTPYATCSAAGSAFTGNTSAPGDYVLITVNFTYASLFPGASITSLFTSPITKTAWMRLK